MIEHHVLNSLEWAESMQPVKLTGFPPKFEKLILGNAEDWSEYILTHKPDGDIRADALPPMLSDTDRLRHPFWQRLVSPRGSGLRSPPQCARTLIRQELSWRVQGTIFRH